MPKQTFYNLPGEKRRLILDLAIEEFAAHDYKNASISNIVARAGVAKGSLYQYFEDKRDLYFYLLELAMGEKKQFLAQTTPPDPGMNLFDYLRWMMRMGAQFEMSRPRLARVAYRALFGDRPFGDEPFEQMRRSVLDYYHRLIDMGITSGCIDARIDKSVAVFMLSTLFNEFGRFTIEHFAIDPQALFHGDVNYQEMNVEEMADQLIGILERGLAPHPEAQ